MIASHPSNMMILPAILLKTSQILGGPALQLTISTNTAHAGIIRNSSPKDVAEVLQIDDENDKPFRKDAIGQETSKIGHSDGDWL